MNLRNDKGQKLVIICPVDATNRAVLPTRVGRRCIFDCKELYFDLNLVAQCENVCVSGDLITVTGEGRRGVWKVASYDEKAKAHKAVWPD